MRDRYCGARHRGESIRAGNRSPAGRRANLDEGARLLLAQETVTADQFPAIRSAGPETKSAV